MAQRKAAVSAQLYMFMVINYAARKCAQRVMRRQQANHISGPAPDAQRACNSSFRNGRKCSTRLRSLDRRAAFMAPYTPWEV